VVSKIVFTRSAAKTLERSPADRAGLSNGKIKVRASESEPVAKKAARLNGMLGCFRLRVGQWRVIYRVRGDVIDVLEIVPRGAAYK